MTDYISREAALEGFESCNAGNPNWTPQRVKTLLLRQPAADVAEVVRCENCEFSRELTKTEKRIWLDECRACESPEASQDGYMIVFPEHFCSYGERREGGNDNVSD